MCMPGGAGTRLERDARATNTCRSRRLKQRVNPHPAGKIFGRPFTGTLRTRSFYLHSFRFPFSLNSVKERGSNGALRSQPSTCLKPHSSAQHFHRVPANTNVGDALAV